MVGKYSKLSLCLDECYVCCTFHIFQAVSLQIASLTQSTLSTIIMAAVDASQITPEQIMHVFVLCCSIQIVGVYSFDSCKSLTCYMVCIN